MTQDQVSKTLGSEFILLDRSGSMTDKWSETLSSINAYVRALEKDVKITFAVFDHQSSFQFDVLRHGVLSQDWSDVTARDALPRGYTPLFDAIGRIVALAEATADEKTVIVVLTDGQENQSFELTQAGAKAALDRCRQKNWQVVFLGADFDAFSQASSVGTRSAQTMNMTKGNYGATMNFVAQSTKAYRSSGAGGQSVGVEFTDEQRDVAAGKIESPA